MIFVLNYEGTSFISKCIKYVTWSRFSHSSIADISGESLEAWHIGGVAQTATPWTNHTKGTKVTIYAFDDTVDMDAIWGEMSNLVGMKYDFVSLLGFIPFLRRFWEDKKTSWFCSHAVAHACKVAGCSLFSPQTPLYKISPGLIDLTPKLKVIGTATCPRAFAKVIIRYRQERPHID